MNKNSFQLGGFSKKNGYDWWWHSLVATDETTGEQKPFFIEYYVINPGLWKGEIVWGQKKETQLQKIKPCYAMLKAGTWGNDKAQLHNFYPISEFNASTKELHCKIGNNIVTENYLEGEVYVSEEEKNNHPEWMSDAGSMKWKLHVEKDLCYDVGYGSSPLSNFLGLFHMYWHVAGMKCRYSGEIVFNNRKYIVRPETSYGYQDKNWGREYTNPWIWLNCNNFKSVQTGETVDCSYVSGGGCPKVLGIALPRRILTAFYYKGNMLEFNFSKFWKTSHQHFTMKEDDKFLHWHIVSDNKTHRVEAQFRCEKSKMLWVNYENPKGEKKHNKLWNGGHAEGVVKFYKKEKHNLILIDELHGSFGGCEYGEY